MEEAVVQEAQTTDYESMSVEELEKVVATENAAPAVEQAPAKPEVETPAPEAKPAETQPEFDARKEIENLRRELGRYRSMQSKVDGLEKTVEQRVQEALAKRVQEQQRQSQLEQLTPEQREQYQAQQSYQEQLRKVASEEARKFVEQEYGSKYGPILQRLESEQQDAAFQSTIAEIAGEEYPGLQTHIADIWKGIEKELGSADPDVRDRALERFDAMQAQPARVVLEAKRIAEKQAAQQVKTFTDGRSQAAKAAAQTPAGSPAPAQSKKSVKEMSQAELDALPTAELEKRMKAEGL